MKGTNHMILNHETMLQAVNIWFQDLAKYCSNNMNTKATRIKVLRDPLRFDVTFQSPGQSNPDAVESDSQHEAT